MLLDILLEPPGLEADKVLQEWIEIYALQVVKNGIEVSPDRCLDVLVGLRSCCFDRGLTLNVKFTSKED